MIRRWLKKYERPLPYAAFIAVSLALGAIMADLNPDYTRAFANWLTMTFAAIGLYIAINKYGFDLEEISKKDLRYLSSVNKKVFYKNENNEQIETNVIVQEFKNDADTHAHIKIPANFDATILYKESKTATNYRILWDGTKKELVAKDPELLLVKSGETIEFTFLKHGALQPTLEYYYGSDSNTPQYLTLYLP